MEAGDEAKNMEALRKLIEVRDDCPYQTVPELLKRLVASPWFISENYLTFEPRFIGRTDYIDGIGPSAVGNRPVTFGLDRYNRVYLCLQLTIKTIDENGQITLKSGVYTIFQRYTDAMGTMFQTGQKILGFRFNLADLPQTIENIEQLLNTGCITIFQAPWGHQLAFMDKITLTTHEERNLECQTDNCA